MAEITRKGFLGAVAAAVGATIAAPAAADTKRAPRPATITQAELRRGLLLFDELDRLTASIRSRMVAGAAIESGPLGTVLSTSEDMACSRNTSWNWRGLDVLSAEEATGHGAELSAICAKAGNPDRFIYAPKAVHA